MIYQISDKNVFIYVIIHISFQDIIKNFLNEIK